MRTNRRAQRGFSLIELMIALLIGLILVLGITSLFSTTSNVNRMENGLARLQENGRFALSRIAEDIRMATAMRSMRKASEGGGVGSTNPDRPLLSFVDFSAGTWSQSGLPGAPPGTAARYLIPPSVFLRGHDCAGGGCDPALGGTGSDLFNVAGYGAIPAIGTGSGNRANGADVLTLRYVRGEGIPVAGEFAGDVDGGIIELNPDADLYPDFNLGPSGLVVIGDYATTAILAVRQVGARSLQGDNRNLNGARVLSSFSDSNDARVNDFDSDFVAVSYYLRLGEDPSRPGRMISTLRRRENGVDVAIAEGIERLDFRYLVENSAGNVLPMSANEVQDMSPVDCPMASLNPPLAPAVSAWDDDNCGWRAVRAIEVFLLANTIDDAGSLVEPFQYSFLPDGSFDAADTLQVACDPAYGSCPGGSITTLPSGLPPGRMLRREFRTVVAVRNNAY